MNTTQITSDIDDLIAEDIHKKFHLARGVQFGLFLVLTLIWWASTGLFSLAAAPLGFLLILALSWAAQSTIRETSNWQQFEPLFSAGEALLLAAFILIDSGFVASAYGMQSAEPHTYLNWPWALLFVIQTASAGLSGSPRSLFGALFGAVIGQIGLHIFIAIGYGEIAARAIEEGSTPAALQTLEGQIAYAMVGLIATALAPLIFWSQFRVRRQQFQKFISRHSLKARVQTTFGPYLPQQFAQTVLASEEAFALSKKAVRLRATILVATINEADRLANDLKPEQFIKVVSEFRAEAAKLAAARSGYAVPVGSAGLALIFNLLTKDKDHAASAIRTGLDLQRLLSTSSIASKHIGCLMGIHTGATVGGIAASGGPGGGGGYVLGGACLETALQLAELAPAWRSDFILSHATKQQAGEGFKTEVLGTTAISGQAESITIHKLV